jgi:hypothetical protein
MKHNLYEQMEPRKRAFLILNKYPLDYVKESVNGIITQSRKRNETHVCNYWNEVAVEIKEILKTKNIAL